ncbi:MAG: hypothetical protein AAY43_06090 [Methanosarcina sp. 795]|uniref:Uncharacterized protein n=2 Tax=Methanosarcina thermophila TaxID=2210 RepID=A0A0E3KR28_METTE|nr:hypothetical protein MSTHT_2380 [Methanosarcina thermophila TM-1]AKB15218.1 hypothetical protein MSTHC_0900 [Methanosarcina thermophila CHTI-55]ALK05347.1 MAG: hypothetical protein AAY43_06090 [Methanosarcina sp. 795]
MEKAWRKACRCYKNNIIRILLFPFNNFFSLCSLFLENIQKRLSASVAVKPGNHCSRSSKNTFTLLG